MKSEKIELPYTLRSLQDSLIRTMKRFNVWVLHRRFGKTVLVIKKIVTDGLMSDKRNPQYAYIAPNYAQAKRVAWEYFKEMAMVFPGAYSHEQELRIDIPRPHKGDKVRFMLLGAEKPDSLRGIYLDGVALDEYAQCDPTIWSEVIRPALSDRKGWAIFIGTPKGRNHFYDLYSRAELLDNWHTAVYKASTTGVVDEEELTDARATMSEEEYNQEYECSFNAAMIGAYFGKEMEKAREEKRITKVPHDPAVPVYTYWDLGIGDTTAIWFVQQVGKEYHLIDYIEESGQGLPWYAKQLKEGHRRDYNYETARLPHDGAARELGTGKSRQETLRGLGVPNIVLPKYAIDDRINAARLVLSRCWFDAERCEKGIKALENYSRKWDNKRQVFSKTPLHDWASNGADSFTYFGAGHRDEFGSPNRVTSLPRNAITDYNVFG